MKKISLVYISKHYNYYEYVKQILNDLQPVNNYVLCRYNSLDIQTLRMASIPFTIVQKDLLYNFIRDESFLTILFYDGEDSHAADLIRYCEAHRRPILLNANADFDEHSTIIK